MKIERGSTWNRWDFHIHTPYSVLNNCFGFDPDPDYKSDIEQFDAYVSQLFVKAVEQGVVAIGITDYFSIDGYKRIRCEYLEKPEKMEELFPDEELRSKIEKIFVFPNIEFRIPTFIGKNAKAVNFHVIFSDDVSPDDIESSFLFQLHLKQSNGRELPLCRTSIKKIGADYKEYNPAQGSDYHVGLDHITVGNDDILKLLSDEFFKEKYLISIPVDEDLSSVSWQGRDSISRKILYQQCHCLMTSNEKTRTWALGGDGVQAQIEEFGSLKPCIWGSDAHSYEQMYCPSDERYCWVKAEPTFEGLQQILCEPEDRIRVQKYRPEEKDEHQLIDYIVFRDEDFPVEPVYFSEGLTTIIGGKSTGKSILLRHIAKCIDPEQVDEREKLITESNNRLNVSADVVWKDGVSGERKIIYIPQSWLNRIVDEKSGNSQLNKMLQGILLQQEEIGHANSALKNRVAEITESIRHDILDYVASREKSEEYEERLRDNGRSEAFRSAIDKLEKQREELSAEAGITEEILKKYAELEEKINEKNEIVDTVKREEPLIEFQKAPFVYLPQITAVDNDGNPRYDLDNIPSVKDKITEAIQKMNAAIIEIWEPAILGAQQIIESKKTSAEEAVKNLNEEIRPLQEIVSKNDQLKKIESQIQEEKERLRTSKVYEDKKRECDTKSDEIKKQIISYRKQIQEAYDTFALTVTKKNTSESDLEFVAEVRVREHELFDAINALFDNRNMRPFKEKYRYNLLDKDDLSFDDKLFESIWEAMDKGILSFKGGNTLQTALERLFSDWLYIHYVVKSGTDTISSMSPGKKALVLLEMIVNLEKSKCPILIDQPEDDLDNRSIYKDLVSYLKKKKHERQIIVVTHNANVVVGADAEEVIIANQDGTEAPNHEKRFEYRSGAIENINPVCDANEEPLSGVLYQKGIQDQICDILEGGKDAFEKRRNKYLGLNL